MVDKKNYGELSDLRLALFLFFCRSGLSRASDTSGAGGRVFDARQRMGGAHAPETPAAKRGRKKHYGFSRNNPPHC